MIVSFPKFLPDELFYSCCARYHNECGNTEVMQTLNDLFGKPHMVLDPTYPKCLDFFVAQLNNIDVNQIIYEHTIFPLFVPFLENRRIDDLYKMFRGEGKNYANHIIGIKNDLRINSLKYCRTCLINDDEMFGVPYWHRTHHLPGVHMCSAHHVPLESKCPVCSVEFKPKKGKLTRLNRYCENGHDMTKVISLNNIRDEHFELMNGLAQDVSFVFHHNEHSFDWSEIYVLGLRALGYCGKYRRINLTRLRNDMKKAFPESFLARFDCQLKNNGDWLKYIYLKKQVIFHPIQHLLLIRFLFGSMGELVAQLEINEPISKSIIAA
ncbi:TnsD family Tn7-like transposition protein [Paenibacillus roseipurpureus]|uniref:TnsD family Tn7-like transposition protein n=1 Tax=Paenibacillus roseopurpureus TaxID=2918901 RepID=A0AA96LNF9_9BACL|nr:TnsD family Tn7-like transposition protein [Paenibacillus sp. MBLB1832]WNR45227.1 TnsD family Tn7-like transposition protein [Paenibacillus sp. MBLB1832]